MKTILAIVLGGLVAGALDIISAFASLVKPDGPTELSILQYIASGLLGAEAAFAGGWGTGAVGLAFHFGLTLGMAAVFVVAARFLPLLLKHAWIAGALFGVAAYVIMTYLIVPMSAAPNWTPATGWPMVQGLMAHIFFVGLPIALIAKRFA